ncbi:MFS transporter [Streptacidiphilus pinicola]|nr:MFS transporter [Streptacidiphilus pinicola]
MNREASVLWNLLGRAIGQRGVFEDRLIRRLSLASLASSFGQGGWIAANLVLLEHVLHMSPDKFGLARTIAAVSALILVLPVMSLGDRFGTRRLAIAAHAVQILAVAAMGMVSGFLSYAGILVFLTIVRRIADTTRATITSEIAAGNSGPKLRAVSRSLGNVGFVGGNALAIGPLALGGRDGLLAAVAIYGVLSLVSMIAVAGLAASADWPGGLAEAGRKRKEARRGSLRAVLGDRSYIAAVTIATLFSLCDTVLTFAVPLWLSGSGQPTWIMSILLGINVVTVILLQARLVGEDNSAAAMRKYFALSGASLFAALALYAVAHTLTGAQFMAVLILGTLALTAGEIFSSVLLWSLPVIFSKRETLNTYNGAASSISSLRDTIGPMIVSAALLNGGVGPWLAGGCFFAVVAAAGASIMSLGTSATPAPLAPADSMA